MIEKITVHQDLEKLTVPLLVGKMTVHHCWPSCDTDPTPRPVLMPNMINRLENGQDLGLCLSARLCVCLYHYVCLPVCLSVPLCLSSRLSVFL